MEQFVPPARALPEDIEVFLALSRHPAQKSRGELGADVAILCRCFVPAGTQDAPARTGMCHVAANQADGFRHPHAATDRTGPNPAPKERS